jgi:hypothetical protein
MSQNLQPILRERRLEQILDSFQRVGPFTTFQEALETFNGIFYRHERSTQQHNSKIAVQTKETLPMTFPIPHPKLTGIWYSIMIGHVMLFTEWGAFALYIKQKNTYTEIDEYKKVTGKSVVLELAGASGRKVWEFE